MQMESDELPTDSAQGDRCSAGCRGVHRACKGCGVLSGPEHFHALREGYCHSLLNADPSTGQIVAVEIRSSCWLLRESLLTGTPAPTLSPAFLAMTWREKAA